MNSNKKEWYMYVLGAVVVLGSIGATIMAMKFMIPVTNHDIVVLGIGQLFGMALSVVGYFFGSSKSSADKTELLADKK